MALDIACRAVSWATPILSSCWEGCRSEPIDPAEDVGQQVTRDSDLSHLEDDIATVADDLRADLDELFAQRGQCPLLHCIGQRECEHEVAEIVGERLELEPDGVVTELGQHDRRVHLMAFLPSFIHCSAVPR